MNATPADVSTVVSLAIVAIIIGVFISCIPAMLWYTIDDWLAYRTGIDWIGDISFWRTFMVCWFLRAVFGSTSTKSK